MSPLRGSRRGPSAPVPTASSANAAPAAAAAASTTAPMRARLPIDPPPPDAAVAPGASLAALLEPPRVPPVAGSAVDVVGSREPLVELRPPLVEAAPGRARRVDRVVAVPGAVPAGVLGGERIDVILVVRRRQRHRPERVVDA